MRHGVWQTHKHNSNLSCQRVSTASADMTALGRACVFDALVSLLSLLETQGVRSGRHIVRRTHCHHPLTGASWRPTATHNCVGLPVTLATCGHTPLYCCSWTDCSPPPPHTRGPDSTLRPPCCFVLSVVTAGWRAAGRCCCSTSCGCTPLMPACGPPMAVGLPWACLRGVPPPPSRASAWLMGLSH